MTSIKKELIMLREKYDRDRCFLGERHKNMEYTIAGVGVVGGFGCSLTELANTVSSGKAPLSKQIISNGEEAVEVACCKAETDQLDKFLPRKQMRRTDHFSKMALLATYLAFEDKETPAKNWEGDDTGIIVASGYGSVGSTCLFKDSFIEYGDKGASPTMFSRSVHNQASSHLAIQLGITGPNLTISQHYLSFHAALQTACIWLEEKRVKRVIVGGVDEFVEVLGYSRLRFLNEKNEISSFYSSLQNPALIPGEGAGFFLLEKKNDRDSAKIAMPVIGRMDNNLADYYNKAERVIAYANIDPEKIDNFNPWLQGKENPRQWYGEYPTASALDLAYVLLANRKNETTCCMQITSDNSYGIVMMTR